jgi:F5/8 type C domain
VRSLTIRVLLLYFLFSCLLSLHPPSIHAQTVTVDIAPNSASNHFIPDTTLGAGIDRLSTEAIDKAFTRQNLDRLAPSGWQSMTYRQNTDLAVEAWHWNPEGTWSDPKQQGYFTGSSALGKPIRYSYGYDLPRRGFTRNDGTGNSGYSRLTDGDTRTFWKSNPYLSQHFTSEEDSHHPQWVILDLTRRETIDSIRIAWAAPYATHYLIQFWTGDDPIGQPTHGAWQTLPDGIIDSGKGGLETIHLADEPIGVRFLRVLMTQSSNTCDTDGNSDIRNCVGYAIRELYVGTITPDGGFHDVLRHTPDQDQTTTYCSSVDPWHEPSDLHNKSQAQVGFDHFYTSGVTHGLPAMIPIAMIYSQPEDAVAEIQYLEGRHYPISYIEMGEEADGQYMSPEDNAALYLQFATALHKLDPALKLGGPAFQGANEDIQTLPDPQGRTSWLGRFLDYLKAHNRLQDLSFFSFEHYPFEPCKIPWSSLYQEPDLIRHIMQAWQSDGLPKDLPVFITESNLSSSASETYMDNFAGLWLADYIGSFLTAGGDGVYYFHYLPLQLDRGCNNSPGTFGMFTTNKDYTIDEPLSQFFASELINIEWIQPGKEINTVFPASATVSDGAGHLMITAYALHRPDHKWSLMLVNRDQETAHTIAVDFHDTTGQISHFTGDVDVITFGKEQYQWHPSIISPMSHPEETGQSVSVNSLGRAEPDGPLKRDTVSAPSDSRFAIPAASIVILRGDISTSH